MTAVTDPGRTEAIDAFIASIAAEHPRVLASYIQAVAAGAVDRVYPVIVEAMRRSERERLADAMDGLARLVDKVERW